MLLKDSICFECDNKKICRHFHTINNEYSLTVKIEQCDNYKNDKSCLNDKNQFKTTVDNNIALLKANSPTTGFIDLKQFDTIGNISVEGIKPEKRMCEICKCMKPITDLLTCNKCGKEVCQSCSNSYKDINTKEIETICYDCQPDVSSPSWEIKNFIKDESENGKKENRTSNKKSKKS